MRGDPTPPRPARARRRDVAALAAILLFTPAFFSRVVEGGLLYFGDFHAFYQPLRISLGEALRWGLPLWNAHLSNGQPILANPVYSALYPPSLLFGIPGIGAARVLTLLTVVHLAWTAAGVFLLARHGDGWPKPRGTPAAGRGHEGKDRSSPRLGSPTRTTSCG